LVTLIVPLTIMLLAIPLILKKVPRNAFYGFRTALTMASDDTWYRANKISGMPYLPQVFSG
jgi:SdpI/YfhL protein family